MTTATITSYIVTRIKDNGLEFLTSAGLAIGVFIAFLFIIKTVVAKVRKRIQENSLQEDMYSKRIADLAGSMLFILLMIFNILAVFEIIGFDTALIT
jgi:flagellar biosynthesis/type III secretory pathway M-ring protein FliF/YscJ